MANTLTHENRKTHARQITKRIRLKIAEVVNWVGGKGWLGRGAGKTHKTK